MARRPRVANVTATQPDQPGHLWTPAIGSSGTPGLPSQTPDVSSFWDFGNSGQQDVAASMFSRVRQEGEPQDSDLAPLPEVRINQVAQDSRAGEASLDEASSSRILAAASDAPQPATCRETWRSSEGRSPADGHADHQIYVEQVFPAKGSMAGGLEIVIVGENFPKGPLYVRFGECVARAVRIWSITCRHLPTHQIYDSAEGTRPPCSATCLRPLRKGL